MKQKKTDAYLQSEEVLLKEYNLTRKQHYIYIEGFDLKVRVQEIGEGTPLLFIHGGPNSGSTWLELVSHLKNYRCLILDRPGCGLSEGLSYKGITPDVLENLIINVLDGVLDHFAIEKSSFLASSFGGYWAIRYALKRPDKVDKMIQEGAPALIEGSNLPNFMKSIGNPLLKWLIPKFPGSVSASEKTMKELGHSYSIENGLFSKLFMEWYVSLWNNTNTIKHDFDAISQVVKGGKQNPDFILYDNEIEKLDCNLLWLWGKDDAFAGSDIANRIHGKLKNSTLIEFDNSGHLPWLDQPIEHANYIKQFLIN